MIESYFYHHPQATVNVHATQLPLHFFANLTKLGYSITVKRLTFNSIRRWGGKCPGEKWTALLEKWSDGPYFYSHLTDYVRFCLLYLYGGIYSDLDAVLLQPLHGLSNFIGQDDAGPSKNFCGWCLYGGHNYLAPGVMGTVKGHTLPYAALIWAFGDVRNYNPYQFNAVGPIAVTKAYTALRLSLDVEALAPQVLYPVPWYKARELFETHRRLPGLAWLARIVSGSHSLHLFGHVTRTSELLTGSAADVALKRFSISSLEATEAYANLSYNSVTIKGSEEAAVSTGDSSSGSLWIRDLRVACLKSSKVDERSLISLHLSTEHGSFVIASVFTGVRTVIPVFNSYAKVGMEGAAFANNLTPTKYRTVQAYTYAQLNLQLGRLVYVPPKVSVSRDSIFVEHPPSLRRFTVSIYNLDKLVTVLVKTVGRIGKVVALVDSIRRFYPGIRIIVADDAPNATGSSGPRHGFYYLRLLEDVGISAGRNRMLELVQTEYFFLIDDDFLFDKASKIEKLLHALEVNNGFSIAAGKSITDEVNFNVDFSGKLLVKNDLELHLVDDYYYTDQRTGCQHVDIVPNVFMARTADLRGRLAWDDTLKVGEHEDFFLRAKSARVKVLTCASVTFIHDQDPFWHNATVYDRMRMRVYDFWKMSLQKHGLKRLISFGKLVMDLTVPSSAIDLNVAKVSGSMVLLQWTCFNLTNDDAAVYLDVSSAASGVVTLAEKVSGNITSLWLGPLRVNLGYTFTLTPSNGFVNGSATSLLYSPPAHKVAPNLLRDFQFSEGYRYWRRGLDSTFHSVELRPQFDHSRRAMSPWAGRTQLGTRVYGAREIPTSFFYQACLVPPHANFGVSPLHLDFYAFARVERIFPGLGNWFVLLQLVYKDGVTVSKRVHFKPIAAKVWQKVGLRMCLCPKFGRMLEKVYINGIFKSQRGSILWQNFYLNIS